MGDTDINHEFYAFVYVYVLKCLLLKQHRLCMEIIDFSLEEQILKYVAISCRDLGSLLSKDSETSL